MSLAARIRGVGLLGPGLASWGAARDILAGRAPYAAQPTVIPAPQALPATERRRAGQGVRVSLAAGLAAAADAALDPRELAAIFASSGGDGDTLHAICEALASDERLVSPTRFHNSVHNAPSGYWGIATGAMQPADTVAAFDASFGAGLLEALGRLATDPARPVLLIAYEAPYPEPLYATRPVADAFAVALALVDPTQGGAGPMIELATTAAAATTLDDAALEALRRGIPSARSLPLLHQLARGGGAALVIEYLDGLGLAVELRP